MRTVCSLLAVLGTLATVSAQAAFDKSSCLTANAARTLANDISTDGSWNCFSFDIAQSDNQLATIDITAAQEGAILQMYAWNSAGAGGDTANQDYRWLNSASGNRWLSLALPQNNPTDLNNLPTSWTTSSEDRYNAVRQVINLDTLPGWTSTRFANGVYAFVGEETLNPGRNVLILQHPSQGTGTTVGNFAGSFLWRLVYPNTAGINGVITPSSGDDYTEAFGSLGLNRAVQVNNIISPGTGIGLQVDAEFARIGWAMRGFQYTATVTQSGMASGNFSAMNWMGNNPMVRGWSGVANANTSRAASNGQTLWANYTLNDPAVYGAANGNISHQVSTDTDVVTRTWDVPLDFSSVTNWGVLPFTVPSMMQWNANWAQQTSPFLNVELTVTWINDYPMLSALSDATFRNYDETTAMGHTVQDTNNQVPFRIYRVQTNAMWWRARVQFSNVVNLNKPTGVTEDQPGCDPLWEVQVVSDWGSRVYSNGFGNTWRSSGGLSNFGWDNFQPSANNRAYNSERWMTNNYWSSSSVFGQLLPNISPTRNVWLLVRVSATKDVTATGSLQGCGSNWIRVGSASFSTSGVTDQCSSPADCLVDAANNPNKDQADLTANAGINAAARFANCMVIPTVGPERRQVPTTKCVECSSDNNCNDGQYCHIDVGICTDIRGGYYNCDSDSGKLVGLCIAKSPNVLGRRCRSAYAGPAGSNNAPMTTAMIGATSFDRSGNNAPPFQTGSIDQFFVTKGDAANAEFAEGGMGACGEWRFYNGTTRQDLASKWLSSNNRPRFALWTGVCHRGRCLECFPGSGRDAGGKSCLNGRTFSAMDVDGTVRTFAENTNAGTELGTTSMVILLLIVFWMYMYAEAKRWRAANGKPAMTCCECLCCCDACTKFDQAGSATANPAAGK